MGKILKEYITPHPPVIIPKVGKGEEGICKDTIDAMERVSREIAEIKPDTIIFITPHGPVFKDAIAISLCDSIGGNMQDFRAPQVKINVKINRELTENIIKGAINYDIPIAKIDENSLLEYNTPLRLDHGTMVPMFYINNNYKDYNIVHITYGMLDNLSLYRFGRIIASTIKDSSFNVVLIASGDLSHRLLEDSPYGFNEKGPIFDREIKEKLENGDAFSVLNIDKGLVNSAGECGLRSFYVLLGTLDGKIFKGNTYSYEGPFGIGYLVMGFDIGCDSNTDIENRLIEERNIKREERIKNEDSYVKLARESLENYIKHGSYLKDIPSYVSGDMLTVKGGVFVSLKFEGELRGCIGTITNVRENIAQEIIMNAVDAGVNDIRFNPVAESELKDIEYSVDVLSEPVKGDKKKLDPKKYGIIVRKGKKSGLLLPDLEGVDTVDSQIKIALKKAGIGEKETYEILKFTVERHK